MLAGPLFSRQLLIVPRPIKHFLVRGGYVFALLVLMYTAGQATFGWQALRGLGDSAQFGKFLFDLFASIQLTLVIAASLLVASASVAQEKDRSTLVLLMMTDLRNVELVVGKILSSLLTVFTLIAVSLPVFCLVHILGSITVSQILWVEALCVVSALAAGAWGVLVAFWREKTFQTLAISALGTVLFIGLVEAVVGLTGNDSRIGELVGALNPYRALLDILNPLVAQPLSKTPVVQAWIPVAMQLVLAMVLMVITILRVRVWNPSQALFAQAAAQVEKEKGEAAASGVTGRVHRPVSTTPIIWREICTRAYGRKAILIKAGYFLFAALAVLYLWQSGQDAAPVLGLISPQGVAFVAVSLLALILVNAQAVTSITSERDGQTLELVMVTEVPAREFILGKLGGVLFNMKEVLAVPIGFVVFALSRETVSFENAIYILVGLATMTFFATVLGLHQALTYESSRQAIANSLGTMFFLFVGIFVCMLLIVEARASYAMQLLPFLVFILGGSVGLYVSLSHKNPSSALILAAGALPMTTFYGITAYLIGFTQGVMWVAFAAYGFATLAMLIPAMSGYDVAFGRNADRS